MPSQIESAKITYSGQVSNLPMSDKLEAMTAAAVRLMNKLGHGECVELGSMGTYNPNSIIRPGVPSQHAYYPPRAIDVSFAAFADGTRVNSLDRHKNSDGHLAIEACLRRGGFGVVLGYDYNSAHHDHWHCDYSVAFGFAGTSQAQFANRCYQYLGYKDIYEAQRGLKIAVDGDLGPQTMGALCDAVVREYSDSAEEIPDNPSIGDKVVLIDEANVTYTLQNRTAWCPLRSLVDKLNSQLDTNLEIDTSHWPTIIIKKEGE